MQSAPFYSDQLDQFRQNQNICQFLNITVTTKSDDNNLTDKFSALAAANLTQGILPANPFLNFFFGSIFRQIIVAECAFWHYLEQIKSDAYYQKTLINFDMKGYISPIWPWIVLPSSLSILAILFNLSLVFVTAKKISLSKLCNWLIAYDSFCQIPAVLPFCLNLLGVIANWDPIDFRVCLACLMLSTGACYASFLAFYLMSLERLLIVLFPLEMNRILESTIKFCSLAAFVICTIFGAIMTLITFNIWTIINLPYYRWLYCNTGLYSDVLNTVPSYVIISAAILNYAILSSYLLWHRQRKVSTTNSTGMSAEKTGPITSEMTRRMLRSVITISLVLFIGWIVGSAARNQITNFIRNFLDAIVPVLIQDPETANFVNYNLFSWLIGFVTCLFVIASGISAPILIISNSEYRKAYRRIFLKFLTGKKSSVGPLFVTKQQ